jgi:hypothetical protein
VDRAETSLFYDFSGAAFDRGSVSILSDPADLVEKGMAGVDSYWNLVYSMNNIAKTFGMTYIYYVRPFDNTFQFVFSSEQNSHKDSVDDIFTLYEIHDIPVEMNAAYKSQSLQISSAPFTDAWGTFISGYIPIISKDGIVGYSCHECGD